MPAGSLTVPMITRCGLSRKSVDDTFELASCQVHGFAPVEPVQAFLHAVERLTEMQGPRNQTVLMWVAFDANLPHVHQSLGFLCAVSEGIFCWSGHFTVQLCSQCSCGVATSLSSWSLTNLPRPGLQPPQQPEQEAPSAAPPRLQLWWIRDGPQTRGGLSVTAVACAQRNRAKT